MENLVNVMETVLLHKRNKSDNFLGVDNIKLLLTIFQGICFNTPFSAVVFIFVLTLFSNGWEFRNSI